MEGLKTLAKRRLCIVAFAVALIVGACPAVAVAAQADNASQLAAGKLTAQSTARPTVIAEDRTFTYDGNPHSPYIWTSSGSIFYNRGKGGYGGEPLAYDGSLTLMLLRYKAENRKDEWVLKKTPMPTVTQAGTYQLNYLVLPHDPPTDEDVTSVTHAIAYINNSDTRKSHPEWSAANCAVVVGSVSVTILPKDISSGTTTSTIADRKYTGSPIVPEVAVKMGGKTLAKGVDYTISCSNNIKVGKASMTVKGIGNYTGSRTVNFNIVAGNSSASQSANNSKQSAATSKTTTHVVAAKTAKGAQAICNIAKSQVGKKYAAYKKYGFHWRAWCADFVSWCAKKAGQSKAVPKQSAVSNLRSAIKKAGGKEYSKAKIKSGKYVPQKGDIVIFKSSGASHVGIVSYAAKNTIHYIDGNNTKYGNGSKSRVNSSKCSYSYKKLTCVLHPKYR